MVADLPRGFLFAVVGLSGVRGGPEHNLGRIFPGRGHGHTLSIQCRRSRCAARLERHSKLSDERGHRESRFSGPSGGGAQHCFYVVRRPNGQLFAAWESELARFK